MTQSNCPTCGGPLDNGVCPQCATHAKTPSAATVNTSAPQPPPDIPGYRITSHLGEGGMGSLYLAEETSLGRRVAIKLISHRIASDALSTSRFLREARTLATIEHPHVVRVYSFGEAAGTPYLVMEYVEGETLAQRLARTGRLPVDVALRMARQIVEALEAAWERKVVHRDIKPSNILIDRRDRVLVADFGLAKPTHADEVDLTLTAANAIVGTPHYVSPEQAQGYDVDFRSDVYSLGIMLYQMLTGERPFEGTTPVAVIAKHIHEPLPPLIAKRPEAGVQVERLVRAMTDKDPETWPSSYAKIHETLDTLLGTTPTPSSELPTIAQTIEAPRSRRPIVRMPLIYFAAVVIPLAVFFAMTKKIHKATPPQEQRLVVAVAPFYGPDDDSAREGKLMAALVEREIMQKLGTASVRVIGIDETKKALHSHDEARQLASTIGANAVIWGEAFALRKETEIQPHVTVIQAAQEKKKEAVDNGDEHAPLRPDDAFAQRDRGGSTLKLEAESPNQIELRKSSASGIGDVVAVLAGLRALDQGQPREALDLFHLAPQTVETQRYEVLALLRLEKNADAQAILEKTIAADPSDGGSHALLGDMFVAQQKYRNAAAEYATANALNTPYRAQRGIVAGGLLYVRETYRSHRFTFDKEFDTPYVLAIDPATEHVVARYSLSAVAQSFAPAENGFVVSWGDPGKHPEKATFRDGKFDRELWPPSHMLWRVRGLKSTTIVLANFLDEYGMRTFRDRTKPPAFAPSPQMDDDAPKTLAGVEAEFRARIERDPTQPWYPFLLTLTLNAEGKAAEADAVFQDFLRRDYNVPYYEYSWMNNYLERMRLHAWSDALFAKTIAQRKRIKQPVAFSLMIERLINCSVGRQAACNSDPVRGYPILQRSRLLTGPVIEGEDFAAAAWEKWMREHGDAAGAERERRYGAEVRKTKLNFIAVTAKVDYALAFTLAALLSYVVVAIAIFVAAFRRARHARNASAPRTPPRFPYGFDVLLFGALALGFAYYIAANMAEMHGPAVVLTVSLGIATAFTLHARTAKDLTMFDVLAAITRREHAVVVGGYAVLFVAAAIILAASLATFTAMQRIPVGLADAIGHPSVVRDIESLNTARDSAPSRYLAAIANHYAGNAARAKQLYASVPTAAAAANLEALERGALPTVPMTPDDVYYALRWSSVKDWMHAITVDFPFVSLLLMILSIPVVLLLLVRSRADLTAPETPPRWKLIERIALTISPGGYDLATGNWLRAYAILFAIGFAALPVINYIHAPLLPGPGPLTSISIPNLEMTIPLPFDGPLDTPLHYGRWVFRFALPYARIFYPTVLALLAFAIASHLRRVPRIFRSGNRDMRELPTVVTATEL
jgi:serine/threonine-protein kinase